jgi:hypothetical protein
VLRVQNGRSVKKVQVPAQYASPVPQLDAPFRTG